MDAVALTTGKLPDLLLLIGALEIIGANISARVDLMLAKVKTLITAGNFLPDILVRIKIITRLIDIAELDSRPDVDLARIRLFLPCYQTEQRRFTRAVRADNADNAARGQRESQILEQQFIAIGFGQSLSLNHLAAEPLRDLDEDL